MNNSLRKVGHCEPSTGGRGDRGRARIRVVSPPHLIARDCFVSRHGEIPAMTDQGTLPFLCLFVFFVAIDSSR